VSTVRILVTGATGYVGSRLVSALLDVGYDVAAASRNPHRLADFGWRDEVTGVTLDAHDDASAKKAFADAGPIDVVYYLVHGIGQPDYRGRRQPRRRHRRQRRQGRRRSAGCVSGRVRPRRSTNSPNT